MLFSWGTRENRRKPQIACDHSWTITDAAATRIWFYVFISAALSEHLHSSACWAERAKINMQRVSAVLKRPKRADSGWRYSLSQTLKPSKRFIREADAKKPEQRAARTHCCHHHILFSVSTTNLDQVLYILNANQSIIQQKDALVLNMDISNRLKKKVGTLGLWCDSHT